MPLGARKWLIYPPLVIISLSIGLLIVAGPVPPLAVWGIEEGGFLRLAGADRALSWAGRLQVNGGFAGDRRRDLVAARRMRSRARHLHGFRSLLLPLADRLERRHLVRFGAFGALLAAAGLGVLVATRW